MLMCTRCGGAWKYTRSSAASSRWYPKISPSLSFPFSQWLRSSMNYEERAPFTIFSSLLHTWSSTHMDQLYGLHSPSSSDYHHPPPFPPENLISPSHYPNFNSPAPFPIFGSDQLLSASSLVVSDAASMVAEIQGGGSGEEVSSAIRAKIATHPLYPKLLHAYIECQKVKRLFWPLSIWFLRKSGVLEEREKWKYESDDDVFVLVWFLIRKKKSITRSTERKTRVSVNWVAIVLVRKIIFSLPTFSQQPNGA